jgi:hypothetical protein
VYRIHFSKRGKAQFTEICIRPANKNGTLFDLSLVALAGFEFDLSFKVDISGTEQSHVDIGIQSSYGQIQLRMIGDDLIRRLTLGDQRRDDLIYPVKIRL